jgi:ubiquinone/menaquinone biosynthesis C-methylase UbiE
MEVEMTEDKIKKAYKESKDIYDDVLTQNNWLSKLYINLFWGVDDNKLAKKVLEFIPNDFRGKLLDIPVGTAVFTYQKYNLLKNAEILCIDYSEEMITKAKERFVKISNNKITCQQGDVGNLHFDDESYDILLSMNGFHAFPDKMKAFEETARVIKKGGFFIGCFYIKKEKKLTDLIVNLVLSKKGWFTPPFQTKKELEDILRRMYTSVELFSEKSMVWFKCTK